MRKSKIEFKLDQKLCNKAKNQAIKTDLLKRLDDNKELDIGLEDDDDLDIPDAQSYIHAIEIIWMRWR